MNPDSVVSAASPDSAAVAGFLLQHIASWLPWLPPEISLVLVAAAVALSIDLIERGMLKLAEVAERVPIFGTIMSIISRIWQAEWKTRGGTTIAASAIVNPLLALAVGALGAGNPLVGVIAAGVRSMGTKPINEWAARRLRLGALLLVVGLAGLLFTSPAAAQDPTPAPADTTWSEAPRRLVPEWVALGAGFGYELAWAGDVLPDSPSPVPFGGVRVALIMGSNLSVVGVARRSLEDLPHWGLDVAIWAHY